jgi:hypothetical protein
MSQEPMSPERLEHLRRLAEMPAERKNPGAARVLHGPHVTELLNEVERLRAVEAKLRATIADEHSQLSQELEDEAEFLRAAIKTNPYPTAEEYARACRERDKAKARTERAEAIIFGLQQRLEGYGDERDLSGWSAEENAKFEELYGVRTAMRLRAAHDRVWAIVQELRDEAVKDGRDPYQDAMARRLSAALTGADDPEPSEAPAKRPRSVVGLMSTLQRVSGLTTDELGALFGVSGNAIRLWCVGGRVKDAHYERALDLNDRMQKLPSATFYGRHEALFDSSSGRSVYDEMLAELTQLPLDGDGPAAYFEAGEENING